MDSKQDNSPFKKILQASGGDKKSRGRVEVGEGGRTGWGGVEGRGENADNCN